MVRILPNGEIDSNPAPSGPQRRENRPQAPNNQSSNVRDAPQNGGINSPSDLFNYANERLLALGLPRIPIGEYIVEPIHLVLCVLSLVLFGPMALIAVGIIIYISYNGGIGGGNAPVNPPPPQNVQRPTTAAARSPPSGNPARPKGQFFMGTGQRLGS